MQFHTVCRHDMELHILTRNFEPLYCMTRIIFKIKSRLLIRNKITIYPCTGHTLSYTILQ